MDHAAASGARPRNGPRRALRRTLRRTPRRVLRAALAGRPIPLPAAPEAPC